MPNSLTHVAIMKELEKEKPELFSNIDKKYFYSGTVFPDINYFVPRKAKKNLSFYWHRTRKATLDFARIMLKLAKTKQEKSFALGFFSHAIVDEYIHKYLDKNKIFEIKHIVLEYFLDLEYAYKIQKIKWLPWCIYPKKLLYLALEQDKEKRLIPDLSFNFFHMINYVITIKILQSMIKTRYMHKKERKFNLINLLLNIFFKKSRFEFKLNINELLHPDFKLKQKHLKNLIKKLENAKKEFAKEMKKFNS